MLKIIENKSLFYVCAVLSIIVTILTATLRECTVINVFINSLIIIFLIAMIIFNKVEQKELMKVLIASFLQVVTISAVLEFSGIIEPLVGSVKNVTHLFDVNVMSFRGVTLLISIIFLFTLYINHYVINFTGNASKVAININKVIITIQIVLLVIGKVALVLEICRNYPTYSSMSPKALLAIILNGIPTIIYSLTVVSMEAFVNKERELKNR